MDDSIEVNVEVVWWCSLDVAHLWTLSGRTKLRNLVLFDQLRGQRISLPTPALRDNDQQSMNEAHEMYLKNWPYQIQFKGLESVCFWYTYLGNS